MSYQNNKDKDSSNNSANRYGAAASEHIHSNTQFSKYHNPKGGHGFAAEDGNAMMKLIRGESIEKVGLTNEKNGADYIHNTKMVQVKYCQSPAETINSAFDKNTGNYRYSGMELEVPSDQYEKCIEKFQEKIREGKVFDQKGNRITDPEKAKEIVKKGDYKYEQARNLAKAGTMESLKYDAVNGAVVCVQAGGISFLITLAMGIWSGKDIKEAINDAFSSAIQAGLVSGLSAIAASQAARTSAGHALNVMVRSGIKNIHTTTVGRAVIDNVAKFSLGKSVYGAAATNHVSRIMGSTVVTTVAATAITTAPDFYRALISKNISWTQFSKNLATNAASAAGGVGGWIGGAAAGAAIGSVVPFVGTTIGGIVGGLFGAFTGGSIAGQATKAIADMIAEDDIVEMTRILNNYLIIVAQNYLLLENDVKQMIQFVQEKIAEEGAEDFFKDMYAGGEDNWERKEWLKDKLNRYGLNDLCEQFLRRRPHIEL